jgi:uncharacterized membrane protein
MAISEQPSPIPTPPPVPWILRPLGRILASASAGGLCLLATQALPPETRIVLSLDALLLTFVILVSVLASVATVEQCIDLAVKGRPLQKRAVLLTAVLASVVTVTAIAVMLQSQKGQARWLAALHLAGSLLALLLGWVATQMIFGIQYMRICYGDPKTGRDPRKGPALFFPGPSAPNLWDFMYYSFTIAMCFGTTDVPIRAPEIRRLTLMHAIYSFFFVATIIGFVVSVLSNSA